jgi:hypothetical protein
VDLKNGGPRNGHGETCLLGGDINQPRRRPHPHRMEESVRPTKRSVPDGRGQRHVL